MNEKPMRERARTAVQSRGMGPTRCEEHRANARSTTMNPTAINHTSTGPRVYRVDFDHSVSVNVHNGASGQPGPTWYAMHPMDASRAGAWIGNVDRRAFQRAALVRVLDAIGLKYEVRVDRAGDCIGVVSL